jgi:phosphoadenosine phosphosulfate reductase
MWVNGGAEFPEVIDQMARIRDTVPNFTEVKGRQPQQIEQHGMPVDLIPFWNTALGGSVCADKRPPMQSPIECCAGSLWGPLDQATRAINATLVIRGTRMDESRRNPVKSGHTENGITLWNPIEDWSEQDVRDYLTSEGVELPDYYRYTNKSLACWNCTAFLDEDAGRMRYMQERHPELAARRRELLNVARIEMNKELSNINAALAAA